jgi:hypothetical protein
VGSIHRFLVTMRYVVLESEVQVDEYFEQET